MVMGLYSTKVNKKKESSFPENVLNNTDKSNIYIF